MIRGGHLGISVLGAFQVSNKGDLANWRTGAPRANRVFTMMEQLTESGVSKLVERCICSLTGIGCVSRVYTNLAIIDITNEGFVVSWIVESLSLAEFQRLSAAPVRFE